jgi:hypothetical protein
MLMNFVQFTRSSEIAFNRVQEKSLVMSMTIICILPCLLQTYSSLVRIFALNHAQINETYRPGEGRLLKTALQLHLPVIFCLPSYYSR